MKFSLVSSQLEKSMMLALFLPNRSVVVLKIIKRIVVSQKLITTLEHKKSQIQCRVMYVCVYLLD